MHQPIDILDERDPLALPFLGSLLVHGCVIALFFMGWFWLNQKTESLGDPNPSGGPAYSVSPTKSIPIPQPEAPPNPVAHDTESPVPSMPAEKEAEKKEGPVGLPTVRPGCRLGSGITWVRRLKST